MNNILETELMKLRQQKPLVLCLTNYVTMDFTANCLLSIGAAPIMSECLTEISELLQISNALYLNLGTLNPKFLERAQYAVECAQASHKPVILDPVGAGASNTRTQAARHFLPYAAIVRGNASEIMALTEDNSGTAGVESIHQVSDAQQTADNLARQYQNIIVISGAEDYITDGSQNILQTDGHPLMSRITGMGCSLTAVIAAFCTQNSAYFNATHNAVTFFNQAGSKAALKTSAPGTFKAMFIDELYQF